MSPTQAHSCESYSISKHTVDKDEGHFPSAWHLLFFSILVFINSYSVFPLKHHSGAEQQVWLPAPVPDDLLRLAPGLQSSALRAAETLQRGAGAVRHPAGVCQGEGHSNHPGCLQGMWKNSHSVCVPQKLHFSLKMIYLFHLFLTTLIKEVKFS